MSDRDSLPFSITGSGGPDGAVSSGAQPSAQASHSNGQTSHPGLTNAVIIGPTGSGKTRLLQAIGQACYLPTRREDGLRIEFTPHGDLMAGLMEEAASNVVNNKKMDSTGRVDVFDFDITLSSPKGLFRRPQRRVLHMSLCDGPGGDVFPELDDTKKHGGHYDELIQYIASSSNVVLCVDADDPKFSLLHTRLPKFITRIKDKRREIVSSRALANGNQDAGARLHFDRFLLLLTKIDIYCDAALAQLRRSANQPNQPVFPVARLTPRQAAERMRPVTLAKELLGTATLNMISQAMKPGAQFAVGVVSAGGFDPGGKPLLSEHGTPSGSESREDILRLWSPFGVREVLSFLATGEAQSTIRLVGPDDLYNAPSKNIF